MPQSMTRKLVRQTLKTKVLGMMASGMDIERMDEQIERYCLDLYKISGHLLSEAKILEVYAEIVAG